MLLFFSKETRDILRQRKVNFRSTTLEISKKEAKGTTFQEIEDQKMRNGEETRGYVNIILESLLKDVKVLVRQHWGVMPRWFCRVRSAERHILESV